ncbi:PDZ/DHR/GLGF domain protein [Necator americanus]|uniref:PDZ/DHR/GLGF domain protein n=1 Tax=Necator americanus TaxID=51031 RepID=W2TAW0_NECAM|nr:PDZ/DHR/GLGF domain protein [Necator americanus]ETN79175.1 PDZ/DHR/GLGF domain protein [Necator americanus]
MFSWASHDEKSANVPQRNAARKSGQSLLQSINELEKPLGEQSSVFKTGDDSSRFALIALESDSKGFGFNIVGGKDSPHIPGHSGIFVSVIKQDGPAYNDGRISVGDLILSINGIDLVNKTHDEAVAVFRSQAGSNAQLLVEIGAENRILNEKFTADTHICAGKSPIYGDSKQLTSGSQTPIISYDKGSTQSTPSPRVESKGQEEDDESVSSCAPSVHSYLDDVPRTPKRPMSYLDPRNPSLVTEVLYVSIGLAVISLGIYIGYRIVRRR